MDGKVDLKVCGVCGDKALGYNFNAVTCESCKAFFRRNALAKKEFRCPFNDQCEITTVTRRFCQKCRLDKCFAIGMRKDHIMSEEDKFLKRRKIEENRAKKRNYPNNFKQGFKKIKKEHYHDDESSQEYVLPDYNHPVTLGVNCLNSPSKGSNSVSVINYNGHMQDDCSSIENLTSPEESISSPVEDSMIRNMLNTTPNPKSGFPGSEGEEDSVTQHLVNNNDVNCNHNHVGPPKSITDTARDILEEVQRYN